jgi:hypothetical protein
MLPALVPLTLLLAAGAPTPHPAVENGSADACQACHAQATPDVVKQWEAGRHGLLLVKCFVCHGSTGKDFVARPQAALRCRGCHAAEVASVTSRSGKAQGCFECHAPHALEPRSKGKNPHTAP